MTCIHFYSDQEGIVNATKNKIYFHTMGSQDTCYKPVLCHIMLLPPVLTIHSPYEYLKPDNLIRPKVFIGLVPLPI